MSGDLHDRTGPKTRAEPSGTLHRVCQSLDVPAMADKSISPVSSGICGDENSMLPAGTRQLEHLVLDKDLRMEASRVG
jgi:hypothetical protein